MTKTVTTKLAGLIANAVAKGNTADRAKTTAVDAMVAAGFVSTDFISPKGKDSKSTATEELFGQINDAIVAGFSARAQALVNAPSAKGMTDAQKLARRNAQMQIGAKRNDFKTALAKRESAEASGNTSRTRTPQQRVTDNLNDSIKVLQEAEGVPFDTVKVMELCKKALAETTKVSH
tara:strand:+ start:146 stop:676 length:531 start_codon:yes stop_codon:yes gene_type:complete